MAIAKLHISPDVSADVELTLSVKETIALHKLLFGGVLHGTMNKLGLTELSDELKAKVILLGEIGLYTKSDTDEYFHSYANCHDPFPAVCPRCNNGES